MINQEPTREEFELKVIKGITKDWQMWFLLILGLSILGGVLYITFLFPDQLKLKEENSALKEQNCILVNLINKENTLLEQAMNLPEGTFIRANYPVGCGVIP